MTIRVHLIAWVIVALIVSFAVGGVSAGWNASRSVETEMHAALSVGEQTVRTAIDALPGLADPRSELQHMVRAFNGDRHVRVTLSGSGIPRESSVLAPALPSAPQWFVALIGVDGEEVALPIPGGAGGYSEVLITTDPSNELRELWSSVRAGITTVGVFSLLTVALILWSLGRALLPLRRLSEALSDLGGGNYARRVDIEGPTEIRALTAIFNRMAQDLEQAQTQNQRLTQQLVTLQESERAGLARDLHDEVGPFLFAVNIDAATIDGCVREGKTADIPPLVASIREAVGHMQREIRSILNRLRPIGLDEFGLEGAIGEQVAFWQRRYPEIIFDVLCDVPEEGCGPTLDATIFRVVQEALSNAVRHGRPTRIDLSVVAESDTLVTIDIVDDGSGSSDEDPSPDSGGYGLVGMRERVLGVGGTIAAGPRTGGGFVVHAELPRERSGKREERP